MILRLKVFLQIRFYGTGGFYLIYQFIYGRGAWTIKEMINHFKSSYLLSKPNKPMVNHCLKNVYVNVFAYINTCCT